MSLDLISREHLTNNEEFAISCYQNSRAAITAQDNPSNVLPSEIMESILSELQPQERAKCMLLSHDWNKLLSKVENKLPENFFGQKQWMQHFKIYVKEPPLPADIYDIMNSQCPFSEKGVKIKETHFLILIPGKLKDDPINYKNIGKLIEETFPELGEENVNYLKRHVSHKDTPQVPRWVLIKINSFEKALSRSVQEQKQLLEEVGGPKYCIPRAIDLLACTIAEYARSKNNLLQSEQTVIRCRESEKGHHVILGGKNGFYISNHDWDDMDVSVLPLREL